MSDEQSTQKMTEEKLRQTLLEKAYVRALCHDGANAKALIEAYCLLRP